MAYMTGLSRRTDSNFTHCARQEAAHTSVQGAPGLADTTYAQALRLGPQRAPLGVHQSFDDGQELIRMDGLAGQANGVVGLQLAHARGGIAGD